MRICEQQMLRHIREKRETERETEMERDRAGQRVTERKREGGREILRSSSLHCSLFILDSGQVLKESRATH